MPIEWQRQDPSGADSLGMIDGGAVLTWFAFQAYMLYICSGTSFVPVHVYINIIMR